MSSTIKNIAHKIAHPTSDCPPSTQSSSSNTNTMVSSTYGSLASKVAIITGASRGIGAATALQLASLGAKVVINYAVSSSAAEELVAKIGKENAIAVKADVSTIAGNEQLVKEAVAWSRGKIDILIANAGLLLMKTLEATTEEDFQRTYDLNVKGPYFLVQKAVPYLSEGARVVLMSTTLTAFSSVTPDYLLYCSSKGAIEQMTRIMAKDLANEKINVNCVTPGPTATDMFLNGKSEEAIKMIASRTPHNRLGQPPEIASVTAFLCGPESSWMTGQILRVNGGMSVGN